MPSVTFDGQSVSVKGRRVWLVAAEMHYLLTPRESWGDCLRAILDAGFNTVVLPCAWSEHQVRAGRADFTGQRELVEVLRQCASLGLWVMLKIGPVVGAPYGGGGLPDWLADVPGIKLRQPNPAFFERVSAWYRTIAGQVSGWCASDVASAALRKLRPAAESGPIIAVQIEHEWRCAQEAVAEVYLGELVRFAREVGLTVPLVTANDSFATSDAAPDMLDVGDEPLALLRQLAALRPGFPRLARIRCDRGSAAERMMLTLAGGGQFVLTDAVGALGWQLTDGPVEGCVATANGALHEGTGPLRRIARFASSFGHLFAQLDASRAPFVLDPQHSRAHGAPTAIPVGGPGGTVVFVTSGKAGKRCELALLSPDGRSVPAHVGESGLGWFAFDVDLGSGSRLDYATMTPVGHFAGGFLVFVGPAGAQAEISIDGSPLNLAVPAAGAGSKPTVARVRDLTVVVCNEAQADAVTELGDALAVGAMRAGGEKLRLAAGFRGATLVGRNGSIKPVPRDRIVSPAAAAARSLAPTWLALPMSELIAGTSHRFATLDGPSSMAACGAREGYGWYRVSFRRPSAGKALVHAPQLADRATLWHNGSLVGTFGPTDRQLPIELKLAAGQHTLVFLISDDARPTSGDRLGRRGGLYGPLLEVTPVKSAIKVEENAKADPFALGVVQELHPGDHRPGIALAWRITKRQGDRFLLDLGEEVRATFVGGTMTVNDVPVARWNAGGPEGLALPFGAAPESAPTVGRKGRSSGRSDAKAGVRAPGSDEPLDIRLVLDGPVSEAESAMLKKSATLYEVVGELGGKPSYAFARWSPPSSWIPANGAKSKSPKGVPTWFATTLNGPATARVEISGRAVGLAGGDRMATAIGTNGRRALSAHLGPGPNQLAIFDEEGSAPASVTLVDSR
jgi:hypothetical protein